MALVTRLTLSRAGILPVDHSFSLGRQDAGPTSQMVPFLNNAVTGSAWRKSGTVFDAIPSPVGADQR